MASEELIGSVLADRNKRVEVSVARNPHRPTRVYLRMVRVSDDGWRAPTSMSWMAIDCAAGDKMLELLTEAFKEANRPMKNAEAHEDIC